MTCKRMTELYTDYVDDSLPASLRQEVEEHLQRCPRCAAALVDFRAMLTRLHRLPDAPLPPGFMAGVRRRIAAQRRPSLSWWRSPAFAGGVLAGALAMALLLAGPFGWLSSAHQPTPVATNTDAPTRTMPAPPTAKDADTPAPVKVATAPAATRAEKSTTDNTPVTLQHLAPAPEHQPKLPTTTLTSFAATGGRSSAAHDSKMKVAALPRTAPGMGTDSRISFQSVTTSSPTVTGTASTDDDLSSADKHNAGKPSPAGQSPTPSAATPFAQPSLPAAPKAPMAGLLPKRTETMFDSAGSNMPLAAPGPPGAPHAAEGAGGSSGAPAPHIAFGMNAAQSMSRGVAIAPAMAPTKDNDVSITRLPAKAMSSVQPLVISQVDGNIITFDRSSAAKLDAAFDREKPTRSAMTVQPAPATAGVMADAMREQLNLNGASTLSVSANSDSVLTLTPAQFRAAAETYYLIVPRTGASTPELTANQHVLAAMVQLANAAKLYLLCPASLAQGTVGDFSAAGLTPAQALAALAHRQHATVVRTNNAVTLVPVQP